MINTTCFFSSQAYTSVPGLLCIPCTWAFLTPLQFFLGILNCELPVEKSNEVKPQILEIFLPFPVLDLREQTWLSLNAISLYHFHWLRNDLISQETQG